MTDPEEPKYPNLTDAVNEYFRNVGDIFGVPRVTDAQRRRIILRAKIKGALTGVLWAVWMMSWMGAFALALILPNGSPQSILIAWLVGGPLFLTWVIWSFIQAVDKLN